MRGKFRAALLALAIGVAGCQAPQNTATPTPAEVTSRLLKEKSPYLHQHADNEVDWYAWGEEAFAKARKEDKPIFLSIGYSTCHWCHVMEEESFMDPTIGAFLNEHFVSIKVDRETRPDVDGIYMKFVQQTTGSGGWPLTVFLTPELVPFYGGTYFPNPPRYGKIGFLELLKKVVEGWTTERDTIVSESDAFSQKLAAESELKASDSVPKNLVFTKALATWEDKFDPERGGFLPAPKFPSPPDLDFLLRYGVTKNDAQAKLMVFRTLDGMALGGIRDHLDGGFHRYSTDADWLVPHFEKMLYDQAQLVELYSQAYAVEQKPLYSETVKTTIDYLNRRMRSPEGAYYSAEDADSTVPGTEDEHAEGAFYVWTLEELEEVLTEKERKLAKEKLGVTKAGNASGESQGELDGKNVLHFKEFSNDEKVLELLRKLNASRDERPRPHRDDKILTEWNAMMASGFASASRYLDNRDYLKNAQEILSFIEQKMTKDGRLLRSYLNGVAEVDAFAVDYAQLVRAYIAVFTSSGDPEALTRAIHWQTVLDEEFWDEKKFGYFDTRENNGLLYRQKGNFDGATMSANSATCLNLLELHSLTGDKKYAERHEQLLLHMAQIIERSPDGVPGALSSLLGWYGKHRSLILTSSDPNWQSNLLKRYEPDLTVIPVTSAENSVVLAKYIPYLPEWSNKDQGYFCQDFSCELPIDTLEALENRL